MNKREKLNLLYKSSAISLIAQLLKTVSAIFVRRGFLDILGVELQGTYDVLNNILSMIQLAELGIGTAIVYALYTPIIEHDVDTISQLMHLYKKLYQKIGCIILLIGIILSFKVTFFVEPQGYSAGYVQIAFLIMLISTASTYFLAYKRELLYADQKQYIYLLIDIVFLALSIVGQLISVYLFHSFYMFLGVTVIQNVGSNIVVTVVCDKQYPYLKKKDIGEYKDKNKLAGDIKNIFIGKIGGFVYGSTDNLIISKLVNVASVTFLTNYTYITNMCKTVCSSLTAPIRPMLGNYVHDSSKKRENVNMIYKDYTFIMYAILGITVTGVFNTSDLFVTMWVGENFHLKHIVVAMLCMDMFLGSIQAPSGELVNVLGYFNFDKYMSIVGMLINLVLSIAFVFRFGMTGVLLGTVIAQLFYFTSRTVYLHKHYFQGGLVKYWVAVLKYAGVVVVDTAIVRLILNQLTHLNVLLQFIIGFLLSCLVPIIMLFILFGRTAIFKDVKEKLLLKRKENV